MTLGPLPLWVIVTFLIGGPCLAGWLAAIVVDSWLCLRDLRVGREVDR